MCAATHVTVTALFCSSSLPRISNSAWAAENVAGRSVSVNGNDGPAGEICHQHSSAVTPIIHQLHTIKLQHTLLGDYWQCVRPVRLPVFIWVPSSVPLGTTSKIRSPPGPQQIRQTCNGVSLACSVVPYHWHCHLHPWHALCCTCLAAGAIWVIIQAILASPKWKEVSKFDFRIFFHTFGRSLLFDRRMVFLFVLLSWFP